MIPRRTLLQGLACGALGCSRGADPSPTAPAPSAPNTPSAPSAPTNALRASSSAAAPAPAPAGSGDVTPDSLVTTRLLSFGGSQAAVVVAPTWSGASKLPLLVALHGLGESRKGIEGGAWGWVRDYGLDRAMIRLHQPPLTIDDFQGIYDQKRVDQLNASLAQRPFRGLTVVCPFTPDLLKEKTLDNAGPFATFLVKELLPRVRGAFPVASERAGTGIDGVSLGGRVALLAGLLHPETFAAIGSLQAALQVTDARPLAKRVLIAREKAGDFRLRLLTSEKDFYRNEIAVFHKELDRLKLSHEHLVVPGPHDYPFNRGPGAIEMLLWHDRALRGET